MECRRVLNDKGGVLALAWEEGVGRDVQDGRSEGDEEKWKEVWVDFLGQYYGELFLRGRGEEARSIVYL